MTKLLVNHPTCRFFFPVTAQSRLWAACAALTVLCGIATPLHAQLGSRPAEAWIKTLESAHRIERLKIDDTVTALELKPGDHVADIGAGSGLFCPPLAKAVAPGGKVYAVDIEQDLVDYIAKRAEQLKLTNVQPVLGQFKDPALPVHDLDLAFMFDVLHHIEHREAYLQNLVRYLKPTGRIAVVDFHPELGPHRDDPAMQVRKDQTDAWMAALGYKPAKTVALYDDKWFVIYARSE